MFCRACRYDLRGQVESRCPECGNYFDFKYPESYLAEMPSLRGWIRETLAGTWIWVLRLFLVLLTFGYYALIPSVTHCGGYTTAHFPSRNLNAIIKEWQRQCQKDLIDCGIDKSKARDQLRPLFSATADKAQLSAKYRFRYKSEDAGVLMMGLGFFGSLLALTFAGRVKKWLLVTAILTLIASGISCSYSEQLASLRYRGSYAYLDDYDNLDPPFANQTDGWPAELTIIAIERGSTARGWKTVAMASGFVTQIPEDDVIDYLVCPGSPLLESRMPSQRHNRSVQPAANGP